MSELKTLKDIRTEVDIKTEELDLITELRAEAIKWVKHFNATSKDITGLINMCVSDWIKHFFNISEEDLNGNEPK